MRWWDKNVREILKRNLKKTYLSGLRYFLLLFLSYRLAPERSTSCSRPLTLVTVNLQASSSTCPTQDAVFTDKSDEMWTLWHKNEENYNLRVFNEEPSEPRGWSRLNRLAKTTADANGHQEELQSLTAGAAVGRSCSRLREKDGLKVGTDANVHYCYELTVAKWWGFTFYALFLNWQNVSHSLTRVVLQTNFDINIMHFSYLFVYFGFRLS